MTNRHVRGTCLVTLYFSVILLFSQLKSPNVDSRLPRGSCSISLKIPAALFCSSFNFIKHIFWHRNRSACCIQNVGYILDLSNATSMLLCFVLRYHPKFLTLFLVLTIAEYWTGVFRELFTVNPTSLAGWQELNQNRLLLTYDVGCLFLDWCFAFICMRFNLLFHHLILSFFKVCVLVSTILKNCVYQQTFLPSYSYCSLS